MLEQNGTELSEREKEILKLVATGASNKEIAQQLVISPNTVKVHLRNIFAKISVASRTEATLYAIRTGLVQVAGPEDGQIVEEDVGVGAGEAIGKGEPSIALPARQPRPRWQWIGGTIFAVALIGALVATWPVWLPNFVPSPTQGVVTAPPRWQSRADMPTARAGLAAVTFDNQIYAIAGEGVDGPTSVVERYDPESDTWQSLTDKPTAVADVQAAVIGGKIYVPGGRLASGEVSAKLELFNPLTDQWETRTDLPVALSAYALTAFEGKLYLFGGWDGTGYTAAVYAYDPASDEWSARTPMPTARGFAGATLAGGKIYVLGGQNASGPLDVNESYRADTEQSDTSPWQSHRVLPQAQLGIGVASIADVIYVFGSKFELPTFLASAYTTANNEWTTIEVPTEAVDWRSPRAASLQSKIYLFGGSNRESTSNRILSYQAIYTVVLPAIQR